MVTYVHYNDKSIFECNAQAIVAPVNCQGVMGKGLAREFRLRFPENYQRYKKSCLDGTFRVGKVLTTCVNPMTKDPEFIINFPTKVRWQEPSSVENIKSGLNALVVEVRRLGIKTIAIPALGCGLGLLEWSEVRPLIEYSLGFMPGLEVVNLFHPRPWNPSPQQFV